MAIKNLVDVDYTMDKGRQYYNRAVSTFYNTIISEVPDIPGLVKTEYNSTGKSRVLVNINGNWKTFAYEDPIPTDLLYFDDENNTFIVNRDLDAKNAAFNNVTVSNGKIDNLDALEGAFNTLKVGTLIVNKIDQVETENLLVKDNTITLNSELVGLPETFSSLTSGIIVGRGANDAASLLWHESNNTWVLTVPEDDGTTNNLELFGTNINHERKIDIDRGAGFYFNNSASLSPGLFVDVEGIETGIYYDTDRGKYVVKDLYDQYELIGIDIKGSNRKVKLDHSTGLEVYNNTDVASGLAFIQLDENNQQKTKGSLLFDAETDELWVSTKTSTFPLRDLATINVFGDSWYYTIQLAAGDSTIVLPPNKPISDVSKDLLMVYVNGLHLTPLDYTVDIKEAGNSITLNTPVTEDSTVTVYHNLFMQQNYRLPLKSIPIKFNGVSGKEFFFANSGDSVTGEFQALVIKNKQILVSGEDYTIERLTGTQSRILLTEPLVNTDTLIVYPFLTPNIFLKSDNYLVFKSYLSNIDGTTTTASADILFDRGNGITAGLRWNELNNNLEINTGNGIWDPITGSTTKFDKKKYNLAASQKVLNINDLLLLNNLVPSKDIEISVFRNGLLLDEETDYTIDRYNIIFNTAPNIPYTVTVYLGKAFIKSHNDLVNRKYFYIIDEPTEILEFPNDFVYEPSTDSLNIFVNGVLTHRNVDYVELNERSVKFNYTLTKGTVIQACTPIMPSGMQYNKQVFEFNNTGTGDYLDSSESDCSIIVNRGTGIPSAGIKWDEARDAWYLSNGDGVYKKILSSNTENDTSVKVCHFRKDILDDTRTLDISKMGRLAPSIIVFKNGSLMTHNDGTFTATNQYSYNMDEKKIVLSEPLGPQDKITVVAYEFGESNLAKSYTYTDRSGNTLDIGNIDGLPDTLLVFNNGVLYEAKESLTDDTGDYYYDRLNKKLIFSPIILHTDTIVIIAYSNGENICIKKYRDAYITRKTVPLNNNNGITVDLPDRNIDNPSILIYLNGVLMDTGSYTYKYIRESNIIDIKFMSSKSGRADVIVNNNTQKTLTTGCENIFKFENPQNDYDDTSAAGNWYIKSDRGRKLSSVYLKWDEVDNTFKFNDGNNREFAFPKVVFGTEFNFIPKNEENILFIKTDTQEAYIYKWGDWRKLNGSGHSENTYDASFMNTRLASMEDTLNSYTSRFNSNENIINAATDKVDNMENDVFNAKNSLNQHASRLNTIESDIDTIENTLNQHTNRIGAAENTLDQYGNKISNAENTLEQHSNRITSAENNITTIKNDVTSNSTRIQSAEENITSNAAKISTVETRVNSIDIVIEQYEERIAALEEAIAKLKEDPESGETNTEEQG